MALGAIETADQAVELLNASSALFVENQGQWADESLRYAFFGQGANILHTDTGPVIQLFQSAVGGVSDGDLDLEFQSPAESPPTDDADLIETATVSVSFNGADAINPVGLDPNETIHNYFIGDQSTWRSEVPTFKTVAYPGLYEGIDLYTWGRPSSLKYEFRVAPGVDYQQIEVHYEGIDGLWIDEAGALHVNTPLGELVDDAPFIYQQINGQQVEVPGEFQLIDDETYTFNVAREYDATVELVIDPVLEWSTYIGGTDIDEGFDIALDSAGNMLVTGLTFSTNWTSAGGDTTFNGNRDAYVVKISQSGEHLWSTYIGGVRMDVGAGIVADSANNVLVTGHTSSSGWVSGGMDTNYNGAGDAFVVKLDPAGSHLWSTYLGGGRWDHGKDIAVDSSDNVLVTGITNSSDWVSGGFDTTPEGQDAFVVKLGSSGDHLWSTYAGGGNGRGLGITADSDNNILVTGESGSGSGNWVSGGFDLTTDNLGDAFVLKLNPSGNHLWNTFLGGNGLDSGFGIAADSAGNVLVSGDTRSSGWVSGGYDVTLGNHDAFVVKISPTGAHLWSTYVGGIGSDSGNDIAVDAADNVLVTGATVSVNWISGGFDTSLNGGEDAYVVKLGPSGNHLWSTYIGGNSDEQAYGIGVDSAGNVVVTGITTSTDFASGGYDVTHNGGFFDAFAVKIFDKPEPKPPRVVTSSVIQNSVLNRGTLTYVARFDEPLRATNLGSSDVTLSSVSGNRTPTTFNYDSNTFTLTLQYVDLPDGFYSLSLRSGNGRFEGEGGRDLDGERHATTTVPSGDGMAGGDFVVDFSIETGPPRVIESSVREDDLRLGGGLTYTATFSEQINPAGVVAQNVVLVGNTLGALTPSSVNYNAETATLTASYPALSADQYTLTLRSGAGGLEDLAGNQLDGERHVTTTVPSGDGNAGGDFVVHFSPAPAPRYSTGVYTKQGALNWPTLSPW